MHNGKHWERGRLHVYVGRGDEYGVGLLIDFLDGWGIVFTVWNFYVSVEWWANVGR